jgi:hypothetical protein
LPRRTIRPAPPPNGTVHCWPLRACQFDVMMGELTDEFDSRQSKEIRMFRSNYFKTIGVAVLMSASLIGCAISKPDEKITANVQAAIDRHPDLGHPGAIQSADARWRGLSIGLG